MKLLLTGDWQTDFQNLDVCSHAADDVFMYLEKYKLRGVCFLGDLKKAYNPVDTRVILFWQNLIEELRSKGYWVGILLGNHDRVGQTDNGQNWLPILQRAGADVFAEPSVMRSSKIFGDNTSLFMVPFDRDVDVLRAKLKEYRRQAKPNDLLLFHQDIKGTRYNKLGVRSDAKLTVKDLYPHKYLACVGGHIHLHQRLGENIYYTGSPFCTDWGEANGRKGYIIVLDSKIKFVASSIPGWFDPSWPGFRPENMGEGSKLRIHPMCPTQGDYGRSIEQARLRAEQKYPGVRVFVVPEFEERDRKEVSGVRPDDPDAVKIRAYARQTVTDELKVDERRIVNYLVRKLERAVGHSVRSTDGIRFVKAKAQNFLSFKKAEFDFTKKGITVVQGINEDWGGRSNGAGKTSLLQLLPVGLFGTTFKGQKYDRWSRRRTEGQSSLELTFKDGQGRRIRLYRQRRPTGLRLTVDGVDRSSGLRNDQKDATQGFIEQLAGFTWETFANSVYIDQGVATQFLQGTKKQRSEILAHYQNLERFEKALILVKKDSVACHDQQLEAESQKDTLEQQVEDARSHLATLREQLLEHKSVSKSRVDKARQAYQVLFDQFTTAVAKRANKVESLKHTLATWQDRLVSLTDNYDKARRTLEVSSGVLAEMEDIPDGTGHCPTCLQTLSADYVAATLSKLRKKVSLDRDELAKAKTKFDKLRTTLDTVKKDIATAQELDRVGKYAVAHAKTVLEDTVQEEAEGNKSVMAGIAAVSVQAKKLKSLKQKLTATKRAIVALKESHDFYEYCKEAFSREGIPRFLNEQLVPVLNKSAAYYSDLFTDKTIQVRFTIEKDQFEISVINATGGESAEDQSTGEQALVGLITSFALRSVAPKCNVLVLDEPGAGLDRGNARQFAKGLVKLSAREGSIIVTSHNDAILSELGQERTITVRKKKGISSIV